MARIVNMIGNAMRAVEGSNRQALQRAAIWMVADVKQSMEGNRFGFVSKVLTRGPRKGRRVKVRHPSPPGQPPAVQTGRLRASIAWGFVGPQVARVGTNVKYAPALELGTKYMAPRPFLRPAIDRLRNEWPRFWRGALK